MLVLNRKLGERVVIGDEIVVTVLAVRGGAVKLGFSGPADVPIHREEVHKRLEASRPVVRTAGGAKQWDRSPAALRASL